MSASRLTLVITMCALATPQAHALLSINVTQDYTTVPGWVVNTFTADSDFDITIMVAYSELTSGSMLNLPSIFPETLSTGPGDSYFSINDDPYTSGWLGHGDLVGGTPDPFFDEHGIGMAWHNLRTTDIGTDLHLATLTFSEDTFGSLLFETLAGDAEMRGTFDINGGIASLAQLYVQEPDTDPQSDPGSNPNTGGTPDSNPNPNTGGSAVPEPVGLGIFGAFVAILGGLHRRRLHSVD